MEGENGLGCADSQPVMWHPLHHLSLGTLASHSAQEPWFCARPTKASWLSALLPTRGAFAALTGCDMGWDAPVPAPHADQNLSAMTAGSLAYFGSSILLAKGAMRSVSLADAPAASTDAIHGASIGFAACHSFARSHTA